jgi:multidrug efflux pump subunit AcrA (membrane-fusion protein)
MKSQIKKIFIILILIVIVFFAIKLIKDKKTSIKNEEVAYKSVLQITKEQKVENKENDFIEYLAKFEAVQTPKITTKISGYIENILVEENSMIKKGDLLIKIDSKEFDESLKQLSYLIQSAKYSLTSLEKNTSVELLDMDVSSKQYKTNQKLFDAGAISQDKLDSSNINTQSKQAKYNSTINLVKAKQSEIQSLESQYNSKVQQKNYYTISSPIDAIVEEISQDIGDLTNPSLAIIKLVGLEQKLTFAFASKDIKENQKVFIEDKEIGYIDFIYPSAQNFLNIANINLTTKLENKLNSNISIQVKIK